MPKNCYAFTCARLPDDLRGGSSSDSTTGARSGNSATMRTSHPMALTVFRNVEINRSVCLHTDAGFRDLILYANSVH